MTSRRRRVAQAAAIGAAALLLAGLAFLWPTRAAPTFASVKAAHARSDAKLLDRHGALLEEVRLDPTGRRLDWIALEEVSPALRRAVVAAEDRRFETHRGVDWRSLGGALAGVARSDRLRGASTITMQLAARLRDGTWSRPGRRSLVEKWTQLRAARALELRWSKAEILEAYLNLVTFRGELEGVAAAAQGLFDKQPHGLDVAESLILAALVRSPNARTDQVIRRAESLAAALDVPGLDGSLAERVQRTLGRPYFIRYRAALAPQAAARLLAPPAGSDRRRLAGRSVACTLDARLQQFAAETLEHHLESLRSSNVADGAILVVENRTGEVLAYVGNSGDRGSARYVDGIQAPRQAGSTLKPFVYAAAFERRLLTPASLMLDGPLDVPVAGGVYRPRNYDHQFHGLVTARVALASSLNVPAVRAHDLVGVDAAVGALGRLGFRGLRSADYYGPSLALGSADVTLWDLVNAYRTIANGGGRTPLRLTFDPDAATAPVFSRAAAFLVADILSDRESRARTFALESPLATRFWTAVKTGTSKDMRDNWCIGFSSRYTVGVWTGNFSGAPMWNVTGVTGAAPIWVDVMNRLHPDGSSLPPAAPEGLVRREVRLERAGQARREWFFRGTETELVETADAPANVRIAYPATGTVVALDPDIPPDRQRLFFETEPRDPRLVWVLDGARIGTAGAICLWTPRGGKFRLALEDPEKGIVDSVEFEVRGGVASESGVH
jgi:penicillin-binding protein 1C